MKTLYRILALLLFICAGFNSLAQDGQIQKALKKGARTDGLYWCDLKGSVSKDNMISWQKAHPEYVFFEYQLSRKDNNMIDGFSFMPEKEGVVSAYKRMKKLVSMYEPFEKFTKKGGAWLCRGFCRGKSADNRLDISSAEKNGKTIQFFDRFPAVYWNGEVTGGNISGFGSGFACDGDQWVYFTGTFENGFPIGTLDSFWHCWYITSSSSESGDFIHSQKVVVQPFNGNDKTEFVANGIIGSVGKQGVGSIVEVDNPSNLGYTTDSEVASIIYRRKKISDEIRSAISYGHKSPYGSYRARFTLGKDKSGIVFEKRDAESILDERDMILSYFDKDVVPCQVLYSQELPGKVLYYVTPERLLSAVRPETKNKYLIIDFISVESLPEYCSRALIGSKAVSPSDFKGPFEFTVLDRKCKSVPMPKMLWIGNTRSGLPDGKGTGVSLLPSELRVFEGTIKNGRPYGDYILKSSEMRKDIFRFSQKNEMSLSVGDFVNGMAKVYINGELRYLVDDSFKNSFAAPQGRVSSVGDYNDDGFALVTYTDRNPFTGLGLQYRIDRKGRNVGYIDADRETILRSFKKVGSYLKPLSSVFNKAEVGDVVGNLNKRGIDLDKVTKETKCLTVLDYVPNDFRNIYDNAKKEYADDWARVLLVKDICDCYNTTILNPLEVDHLCYVMNANAKHGTDPIKTETIDYLVNEAKEDVNKLFNNQYFPVKDASVLTIVNENIRNSETRLRESQLQASKMALDVRLGNYKEKHSTPLQFDESRSRKPSNLIRKEFLGIVYYTCEVDGVFRFYGNDEYVKYNAYYNYDGSNYKLDYYHITLCSFDSHNDSLIETKYSSKEELKKAISEAWLRLAH